MSIPDNKYEVTPDLKRFRKLAIFVIYPLILLIGGIPFMITVNYLINNGFYNIDPPLWGIPNLSKVIMTAFSCIYALLMIPLLGGSLLTWFNVRRSNLLHAIVESLNQGKGLDSSYYDPKIKDRDHFYTADDKKLEVRANDHILVIILLLCVTSIPLTCFLIHVFTNDVGDFDVYLLLFSVAGILTTFYNICMKKIHLSFNRTKGTFTYFGFLLPWHRNIKFDKVQINAYANTFKIIIPYRLIPLRMIGEYKDAQAWWSYYMWYMDRNRPLPPGSLFSDEVREQDYLQRKAEGFPAPLYQSSIDTPEWEGAVSKYNDQEVDKRNRTLYKGSADLAYTYQVRKSFLAANTYLKKK